MGKLAGVTYVGKRINKPMDNLKGLHDHPSSQSKLKGNMQPSMGLGSDGFKASDPRSKAPIKKGMGNV